MSAPARTAETAPVPELAQVAASHAGTVIGFPVVPAERHAEMGIVSVGGVEERFAAKREAIPWLGTDTIVPLRAIQLVRGTGILYGSLVGASSTLTKLAHAVDPARSRQAETTLFSSLPDWLMHYPMPGIAVVSERLSAYGLYKAGRGSRDPARLFFLRTEVAGRPAIIRTAIVRHKDQGRATQIMTKWGGQRVPLHFNG